ncbi:hypothetical protein V6N11_004469 [Hibiscus sabdariffa]|uniref:Endonuclease/exonuclease/phosphatase domain-containing protein n=1 Tax=Hibiscus sabdariffa TaxID=183260 RepID=A0ABR2SGB8_9ROSI
MAMERETVELRFASKDTGDNQVNSRIDGVKNPLAPLTSSQTGRPPDDQQIVKRSWGDGGDLMDIRAIETNVEETRNRSIDKGAMASKEEIVPSRVTVNPNNHVVVRVLDRGSEMVAKAMVVKKPKDGVVVLNPKGTHRTLVGKGIEWKGRFSKGLGVSVEKSGPSSGSVAESHADDEQGTDHSFPITFVYENPNKRRHDDLWDQLLALQPDDNMAWVLGDDFNSILSSEERIGGSSRRDDAMWSDSKVLHLNRLDSNHGPLLLVIDSVTVPKRQHGFKYLAAWQSSSGFEDMLA